MKQYIMTKGIDDPVPPKRTRSKADLGIDSMRTKTSGVELVFVNSVPSSGTSSESGDQEYDSYFATLSRREKHDLRTLEHEIKSVTDANVNRPLKYRLLTSQMPFHAKTIAFNRWKGFSKMTSDDHEYFKHRDWFETLLKVPFNKFVHVPVTKYDRKPAISKFLTETRERLNQEVYGMEPVKSVFMQILAQWITNPESTCNAIALEGPPGCGKTLSLMAFAKALGRPFHLIALGGCKDSSFLTGHDFTYLGSKCGHLLDTLIQSSCMNPIIFFDELDKLSDTKQGHEITGLLIHLIDATQNKYIQDKFLSGVHIDFSRALFVFSYNDKSKIDEILLDRIINIKVKGFEPKEKIVIANTHILPQTFKNIGLHPELIQMPETLIKYIMDTYTSNEKGVRNLKRCLEHICMQINLILLTQAPPSVLSFRHDTFPIQPTVQDVDLLMRDIKPESEPFLTYYT